jgi:glycosyltransferase involved in cell wall biosynthesis
MNVGVICACMNREAMLSVSLASWLACKEIREIVIADWSSKESLEHLESRDNRIKVIRINGQSNFNLPKAFNVALQHSTAEVILKLDVDYILNPYFNFIQDISLERDEFLTGHWMLGQKDNEMGFLKYLNGLIYTFKSTLDAVGGYNESLNGYGFDDDDLYMRLKSKGFRRSILMFNQKPYIYHNPHEDSSRSENYAEKNIDKSLKINRDYSMTKLRNHLNP